VKRFVKGFSLLELLIVLVIIAVMSAFIGPKLGGSMSNMNLKTACKRISASLRYARSQATVNMMPFVALFDLDKGRMSIIQVQRTPDTEKERNDSGDSAGLIFSKPYNLPDGVRIKRGVLGETEVEEGMFEIVFFPNGSSTGGEVFFSNERGRLYKVSVDLITGTVRVKEA
jgi:general secretion pathway protein H